MNKFFTIGMDNWTRECEWWSFLLFTALLLCLHWKKTFSEKFSLLKTLNCILTRDTKPFRHSIRFGRKKKLTNHEHIHFLSTVVHRRKQIFNDSSGLRKQFNPVRGSRKMENFFFSLWMLAFATQSGTRWRQGLRWGVESFLETAF